METLSDIVASMRRGTKLPGYWKSCDLNKILAYHADRIDAALKRDSVGNTAAMREALVFLRDKELSLLEGNVRHCVGLTVFGLEQTCKIMRGMIEDALSAPARNCDVGTPEEQEERFKHFCASNYSACDVDMECCRCPLESEKASCEFAWAKMPYTAEEGGAK